MADMYPIRRTARTLPRSLYLDMRTRLRANRAWTESPYAPYRPDFPADCLNHWRVVHEESWREVYVLSRPTRLAEISAWLHLWAPQVFGVSIRASYSPTGRRFYDRGRICIRSDRVYVILYGALDV